MTFQEILPEFLKGSKIRKQSWGKDKFINIPKGYICIYDENDVYHCLDKEDLKATDWCLMED